MDIFYDTYFVVALSFVLFVAILWYYGVHASLARWLDARADRIREELDEAKRLREEAQSLLASYERRQGEVQQQADDIVARAKRDAETAAEDAKKSLADSIERRMKAAEDQIAAAEQAAVREVKDRAVEVATAAAAKVIAERMSEREAASRIDDAIEQVGARLN